MNGSPRDWDGGENYRGRGGGRGRGRGRGRGGHSNNDWDDRREYGRDREPRRGRHEDGHGGRGGRYDDRYDNRGGYGGPGYGGSPTPTSFVPPPMSQPPAPSGVGLTYGNQAGYADPGQPDDRLEQARKVQQLLAALKQPSGTSAASPPNASTPPMSSMQVLPSSMPPYPPYPPAPTLPQAPYSSSLPPSSAYTGVPPPTVPQLPQLPPNAAGLPPNIMALLHTAQHRQGTPTQYGAGTSAGPPAQGSPQYQQLLSYLVCELWYAATEFHSYFVY
jgi:transcription initiation factor TFIID subunit 15